MSKHHTNDTIKSRLLRRGLAGILSLALILGLIPSTVLTAGAASWADSYVQTLADWGVMRGDIGGNMNPDRSITRAEFVTMMNRAYGYSKLAGHPFTDVRSSDWYNEDIDIGYNIGYFKGTSPTTASPNASLTREQAAVLLARNMMLQPTVGETLGFSDTRKLSDWSRGLVGAAAANGIISGYEDGSFQPARNITRGEVAAMLVRAIGTPIQTEGDHSLGNIYGNVTVNTAGVKLRDGVIAGNLYLTGGIDLGDVLLENITVLGEIIVSGGGESNSSQSSIIMRNVAADNLVVDSIGDQFVTIRAEGNTDIPTTTVRTNAYLDDSSLPGYGLSYIELDGDNGTLLQLAGNVKEVWNKTPGSDLQVVQGSADKVTIDENAVGSKVLVDGDARVDDLNLDVATNVTGTGDITNLNVGAAGSTVEQLPDKIEIRPGITTDINGSNMNSSQGAESSADPRLLAGYPAVKNIAPTSATLVFRTNKPGTIYWAVSAVADGSVSEKDLLEPPAYGNKIIASGKITATAANTDYTAAVSKLTRDGSYYVTAMLVDGRDQHSPIKVTSFSTPDDTTPAFVTGYPVISKNTCEDAQVTVMTNKSCLLYYALLPAGATAPTPAEFKSAAIPGNLGYGSQSVTKSVTTPIKINRVPLTEKTNYVLYLWLTDHDGAKSSAVRPLRFTTPDETRPWVTSISQTDAKANSMGITYTINEPGSLVWAVVTEATHDAAVFLPYTEAVPDAADPNRGTLRFKDDDPEDDKDSAAALAAKIKLESGSDGNVVNHGTATRSPFTISVGRDFTAMGSSFVLYYMAKDTAGNYSKEIKYLKVNTLDNIPPKFVEQTFNRHTGDVNKPLANTDVTLAFSENIMGDPDKTQNVFKTLYDEVERTRQLYKSDPGQKDAYDKAREALGDSLAQFFTLWCAPATGDPYEVTVRTKENEGTANLDWTVDWRNAQITLDRETGRMLLTLPTIVEDATSKDYAEEKRFSALNLDSGSTYYFRVKDIYDLGSPMQLQGANPQNLPRFTTVDVQVLLQKADEPEIYNAGTSVGAKDIVSNGVVQGAYANPDNDPKRIDYHFRMKPQDVQRASENLYWDLLIGFNIDVKITIYYRQVNDNNQPVNPDGTTTGLDSLTAPWTLVGSASLSKGAYLSMSKQFWKTNPQFQLVNQMLTSVGSADDHRREYAVHIDQLNGENISGAWDQKNVTMTVAVPAGTRTQLASVAAADLMSTWNTSLSGTGDNAKRIEDPQPFDWARDFSDNRPPQIESTPRISDIKDTSARVTLSLSTDGVLYYLALPVSGITNAAGGLIDTELTEDIVMNVTQNYYFDPPLSISAVDDKVKPNLGEIPLMLNDPDRANHASTGPNDPATNVIEGKNPLQVWQPPYTWFTNDDKLERFGAVVKGSIEGGKGEGITITDLTNLDANTVYLLFLLPSAKSTAPNADNSTVHCYRFTTNMYDIPKLLLSRGGSNAIVNATEENGETAYMRYFAVPMGQEDVEGIPGSMKFSDKFTTAAGRAKASFDNEFTTRFPSLAALKTDDLTVLQAMSTPLYEGGIYQGTMFDLYALDSIKSTYADLVRSTSTAMGGNTGIVDQSGSTPITMRPPNPRYPIDLTGKIEANRQYTVVAIASRDPNGSAYSFCAYHPAQVQDSAPPMLVSATSTVIASDPVTGIGEAYLELTFDKPLYRVNTRNSKEVYEPIDGCLTASPSHGTNPSQEGTAPNIVYYWAAGALSTRNTGSITIDTSGAHGVATNVVTLKITNLKPNGTASISFNGYGKIVDSAGNGKGRAANFSISVKAINTNTSTAEDAEPEWALSATTVASDWAKSGWNLTPQP